MTISLYKIVIIVVSFIQLLFPSIALADGPSPTPGCTQTDFGCIPNDPIGFTTSLYTIGLGLIGAVGVLFIMFGGYQILTSQGDPEKLRQGKRFIYFAIAGLVLAIGGLTLYQTIGANVLRIPGFVR